MTSFVNILRGVFGAFCSNLETRPSIRIPLDCVRKGLAEKDDTPCSPSNVAPLWGWCAVVDRGFWLVKLCRSAFGLCNRTAQSFQPS